MQIFKNSKNSRPKVVENGHHWPVNWDNSGLVQMQERCNRAFVFLVSLSKGRNCIQPRNAFFQRVTLRVAPIFVVQTTYASLLPNVLSTNFNRTLISTNNLLRNETSNKSSKNGFLDRNGLSLSLSFFSSSFIFFFFFFHVSHSISWHERVCVFHAGFILAIHFRNLIFVASVLSLA